VTSGPSEAPEALDEQALLQALRAVRRGDFSVRLPTGKPGVAGEIAEAFNEIVDLNESTSIELRQISRVVGREGRFGQRASVPTARGAWARTIDSVNELITDLTEPSVEMSRVLDAVARGDLTQRMALEFEGRPLKGEFRRSRRAVNTMVDQLNAFASEVTRVAREVGTEGKLGGQADVRGVAGTWKDLTDSVNSMAGNLTAQVRNIAEVVTAVADGDLTRKLNVQADGEIAALAKTINSMTDTLATFSAQVTTVAREVGIEGKLGGQASVPGAAGTWRDLTDNVNQLADNLTAQVRAIGQVATAVARGDLSGTIEVDARGEVELLRDNINEMIRNLRETTLKNVEQYWLKTNLARFNSMLQGQRDLRTVGRLILSELAPLVGIQRGAFYLVEPGRDQASLKLLASYAAEPNGEPARRFRMGEGLVGQCAQDRRRIILNQVPPEYIAISSGLGRAAPHSLAVLPVVFEDETRAVIELASFGELSEIHLAFLEQLTESVGVVLATIAASIRSEELLRAQAARAEAEAGLARLRQVVDVMPEGILIADASGRVYLSNAAAEQIMGSVPETVIPTNGSAPSVRRLDGSLCRAEDMPLARAVFERQVVLGDQLVVTNEVAGRDVPILVNAAPLSDGFGVAAGGVAVFQDIAPLKDLERQKDEFLAAVSHDLKTPATIIMGRANLLQRALTRSGNNGTGKRSANGNGLGDFAEGLQAIDESTTQLVRLVDELLDVTRLRMGQPVELDLGPADLVKIATRLAAEYQKMSPRHVIRVESNLSRLVGDWDEARIERIVANLLSNSVKYSPRGGEIVVRADREDREGQEWAVLTVQDQGMGIPPAELGRVFEPYYRGTNVAGSTNGTGVGLAGTRHIVEQHGGEIAVDSVVGQATTFTVHLPLIRESAELVEA